MFDDRDRLEDQKQASQVGPAIQSVAKEPESGETIMGEPVIKPRADTYEDHRPPPKPKPRPIVKPARRPNEKEENEYPRNLRVDPKTPHLVVLKCGSSGVRFGFDSKWLAHEGFRASMPVRCAYSGGADRTKLIARPMMFMDRCRSADSNAEELIRRHDIRSLADASPRKIMQMMSTIEGMPNPFLYPMPYYVSTRYANKSIHCMTRDRSSGGITAEIVVPDAVCALEWLARVNGVCGKEYELLERDTSLLHGDLFQTLSETCRGRIQVWCKLRPREVFMAYFNDADFGRMDEGLAGLVVTDQRVVFCKYHHRGQVRLEDEGAMIIVKEDGRFLSLSLQSGEQRQRMCKLHKPDLPKLRDAIKKDAAMKVVQR